MSYHFDPNILVIKDKYYYWHKYVTEDTEFIEDATKLKATIDAHIERSKLYSYDPELLQANGLDDKYVKCFEDLAKKYRVSKTFLTRYLDGAYPDEKALQAAFAVSVRCKEEDGWISLKMGKDITQEQFRQLWPMVELTITSSGSNVRKRDVKADMKLVYCIQRALDSNYSFEQIASLYTQNKLQGYDSSNDEIRTPKWLRSYYRRHSYLNS